MINNSSLLRLLVSILVSVNDYNVLKLVREAFIMLASVVCVLWIPRQISEALWRGLSGLLYVLDQTLKGNNVASIRPY